MGEQMGELVDDSLIDRAVNEFISRKNKIDNFQFDNLRKILKLWWPQRVNYEEITEKTSLNKISEEISRKRWNSEKSDNSKVAL